MSKIFNLLILGVFIPQGNLMATKRATHSSTSLYKTWCPAHNIKNISIKKLGYQSALIRKKQTYTDFIRKSNLFSIFNECPFNIEKVIDSISQKSSLEISDILLSDDIVLKEEPEDDKNFLLQMKQAHEKKEVSGFILSFLRNLDAVIANKEEFNELLINGIDRNLNLLYNISCALTPNGEESIINDYHLENNKFTDILIDLMKKLYIISFKIPLMKLECNEKQSQSQVIHEIDDNDFIKIKNNIKSSILEKFNKFLNIIKKVYLKTLNISNVKKKILIFIKNINEDQILRQITSTPEDQNEKNSHLLDNEEALIMYTIDLLLIKNSIKRGNIKKLIKYLEKKNQKNKEENSKENSCEKDIGTKVEFPEVTFKILEELQLPQKHLKILEISKEKQVQNLVLDKLRHYSLFFNSDIIVFSNEIREACKFGLIDEMIKEYDKKLISKI